MFRNIIKFFIAAIFVFVSFSANAQINRRYVYYVGQELIVEGKYESAIDVLNMLLRADKLSTDAYFLRGVAKYNLGDYIGAEADFSKAIEINSVYTMAYHYRAITRSYLGNYEDSLADFAKAIDIRPDQDGLYYSRGVTYFLSQQWKESIEDFNHYLRRQPHSVDGYVTRGTSYLMLKDTISAFNDYDRAAKTNIYDPDGYVRRGSLYLQQSENGKALEDLTYAIKLDSTIMPAYFNRALVYNAENRPMDAIKDFDRVVKLDSLNSLTYFNRALLLSQIGDYNRAMDDYNKVSELSPNNVLLYFNRGALNNQLGEVDKAEEDFTTAIELYPDFANAYMNRSAVRHRMGKMDESKLDYDIAQKKIEEYRSKMSDSTFMIYADTSKVFSSLLSFDADFGNKDFEVNSISNFDVKPISMSRFTITDQIDDFQAHLKDQNRAVKEQESILSDYNLMLVSLDQELDDSAKIDSIEIQIDKKLDDSPYDTSLNLAKGAIEHSRRQYSNAIAHYSKAITVDSKNPFYFMARAVANAEMTEFVAQIDNQSQRLVIDADPVNQLKSVKRTYNYDAAIKDINRAISLDSSIAELHYNKGCILTMEGKLVEAIDSYTTAIELNPQYANAYLNRGLIQISLKERKKGFLDVSQAGELGNKLAYEVIKRYGSLLSSF